MRGLSKSSKGEKPSGIEMELSFWEKRKTVSEQRKTVTKQGEMQMSVQLLASSNSQHRIAANSKRKIKKRLAGSLQEKKTSSN